MKDKEVLQKSIEIAMENGMSPKTIDKGAFFQIYWLNKGRGGSKLDKVGFSMEDCYGVIFSHDFAKAFWKNDFWAAHISTPVGDNDNGLGMRMSHRWQYHLQQMVLQENPINYLRKFINTDFSVVKKILKNCKEDIEESKFINTEKPLEK